MTTGDRIKQRRLDLKMSQEELGSLVGVKKAAIHKYENNVVVNLKRSMIAKLANALNTTPAYLMGWDAEPTTLDLTNDEKYLIVMYRGAEEQARGFALEMLENHQREEKANHA